VRCPLRSHCKSWIVCGEASSGRSSSLARSKISERHEEDCEPSRSVQGHDDCIPLVLMDWSAYRLYTSGVRVRDSADKASLAVRCRGTVGGSRRRILRNRLTVSQFVVPLPWQRPILQYRTRRHGAHHYSPYRCIFRRFACLGLDLGNTQNSTKASVVLSMVLLRSEPNPKLALCDCNTNCILGFGDLVLCAFDGLTFNAD
jgi:hypothetical protein